MTLAKHEQAQTQASAQAIERVVIEGDLDKLNPAERVSYYFRVCESIGVNPYTKPFAYLKLNNRLVLYALKDCTDQLRHLRKISVSIISRETINDVYIVTAKAITPDGRFDESIGAVSIASLRGDSLANALMRAESKAKRRATLSIVGLGWLDETETDTIQGAQTVNVDLESGEILSRGRAAPARAVSPPKPDEDEEDEEPEEDNPEDENEDENGDEESHEERIRNLVAGAELNWEEFKRRRLGGAKTWADWVTLNKGDEALAYDKASKLVR